MNRIKIRFRNFRHYLDKFGLLDTLLFYFQRRIYTYRIFQDFVSLKDGLEIGGPSDLFGLHGAIPIYHLIRSLDNVNFSPTTVWSTNILEGQKFIYGNNRVGEQIICDSVDLNKISVNQYDFILSCNNLEHIANPIKAIVEWIRVLKPNGIILLVLPNKDSNFDHRREPTAFDHVLNDFVLNTSENDLTHLREILELHDLKLDPLAGEYEDFVNRSLDNLNNRCLHHHIFNLVLVKKIFNFLELEISLLSTITTLELLSSNCLQSVEKFSISGL